MEGALDRHAKLVILAVVEWTILTVLVASLIAGFIKTYAPPNTKAAPGPESESIIQYTQQLARESRDCGVGIHVDIKGGKVQTAYSEQMSLTDAPEYLDEGEM